MKIAVYAIARNEAAFVARFCASARDADYLVIADTGSTDNTASLASKHGATVHSISIQPWRFDAARNASLALVPADADVCICLDLDEVLEPDWRAEIERCWSASTSRLSYRYDWGAGVVFFSDKVHARAGYAWKHPCHELLHPSGAEVWARCETLLITHHPDASKSRGGYLDLLRIGHAEDPNCTRNSFYFGRELCFARQWPEAVTVLTHFLTLDGWRVERAYAMRLLGQAHHAQGELNQAEAWFLRACAEDTTQREPLCDLAEFYGTQKRWLDSLYFAERALAITEREWLYTVDPACWSHKPHDLAALACHYLGRREGAMAAGEAALAFASTDTRLAANLNWYRKGIE